MALTESRIRRIIREETARMLSETYGDEPEEFSSSLSGGYEEQEKMDRASEMGEDDDEEEETRGLADEAQVEELMHNYMRHHRLSKLYEEFSHPRPGEVDFDELLFSVKNFVKERMSKRYSDAVIHDAAEGVSSRIQDYGISNYGRSRFRSGYGRRY